MNPDMNGKVVLITGATSGIGQVAAESLAEMGAQIVQIARDQPRGQAALDRLKTRGPGAAHAIFYADLSLISEVKRVAAQISQAHPHIDVLINNAGALFGSRHATSEGLENTFALNHMSYFVLTACLRPLLLASAPSRIVNTASDAHEGATLDFADLQSVAAYRGSIFESIRFGGPGFKVYGRSKLCNILFTRELARQLAGTGVTANCFHPGFVASRFGHESGGFLSFAIGLAQRFAAQTPAQGAQTLIYLASSPEVAAVTGKYFQKCKPAEPSPAAQDEVAARRLWQESAQLAGLPLASDLASGQATA